MLMQLQQALQQALLLTMMHRHSRWLRSWRCLQEQWQRRSNPQMSSRSVQQSHAGSKGPAAAQQLREM